MVYFPTLKVLEELFKNILKNAQYFNTCLEKFYGWEIENYLHIYVHVI